MSFTPSPPDRVVASLVVAHERYYAHILTSLPALCPVVQPQDRGTAPAILYSVLRLAAMTTAGPVAILPSDHYISDDIVFMKHVDAAFEVVAARPDLVVLLGVPPTTDEAEHGWIEAGEPLIGSWSSELRRVRQVWEKPAPRLAQTLRASGCLWNSFVIVAYPSALLAIIKSTIPVLFDAFASVQSRLTTPWEAETLQRLYAGLPFMDFSERVLAMRPANLAVLTLSGVEWGDLGHSRGL